MMAAGEGPHAAIRNGQRVCGRHPPTPGARAGGGAHNTQPGLPAAGSSCARPPRRDDRRESLVLVTLLGGLAAVAAVQTVANTRLAESLKRETNANAALNEANGQLSRSRAVVQAPVRAGDGRDQDVPHQGRRGFPAQGGEVQGPAQATAEFGVRLRLAKLGAALLGKETDLASRQGSRAGQLPGCPRLTDKVGRKEDTVAAHRQVLAAREALAAEPEEQTSRPRVDVGCAACTAVAGRLSEAGKTDLAEATYRKAETLLADLARSSPSTQAARARGWRTAGRAEMGTLSILHWQVRRLVGVVPPGLPGTNQEAARPTPPAASKEARYDLAAQQSTAPPYLLNATGKKSRRRPSTRKAIAAPQKKLADDDPAVTLFRSDLAAGLNNLGLVLDETSRQSDSRGRVPARRSRVLMQTMVDGNARRRRIPLLRRTVSAKTSTPCRCRASRRRRSPSAAERSARYAQKLARRR